MKKRILSLIAGSCVMLASTAVFAQTNNFSQIPPTGEQIREREAKAAAAAREEAKAAREQAKAARKQEKAAREEALKAEREQAAAAREETLKAQREQELKSRIVALQAKVDALRSGEAPAQAEPTRARQPKTARSQKR